MTSETVIIFLSKVREKKKEKEETPHVALGPAPALHYQNQSAPPNA